MNKHNCNKWNNSAYTTWLQVQRNKKKIEIPVIVDPCCGYDFFSAENEDINFCPFCGDKL